MIKTKPHLASPKICLFDIETAPSLGYFWGKLYETDIIEVTTPWFMLCYSWKWLGEKKIHTRSLRDYPHYTKNLENDQRLVTDLHKLFDEADILIAHNGDRFDIRKTNAKFIKYGLKPPSTYKTVDTLKIARKHFLFESSRLNALGEYLGFGGKRITTGFNLWKRCMRGESDAWHKMELYNRRDIILLEKVYEKLRPYATTHPNLELYKENGSCPRCQSLSVERAGIRVSVARKYQRWRCNDCGHWFQGVLIPREHGHS